MSIDVGKWYHSKRGHLCRAELLHQDGSVTVTSHYTGNKVKLHAEEVKYLKETHEPNTPIGTALQIINSEEKNEYFDLYKKYKHVIPGSIYKVQSTNKSVKEKVFKVDGKTRVKTIKTSTASATRCKIKCQTPKCKNTRDIKIQDAWSVKFCEECRKAKKREYLKTFLKHKKNV